MSTPPEQPPPSGGWSEDLAAKIPFFAELEKLLAGQHGPVNWDLARQVAIRDAAEADIAVLDAEVDEAVRLADLWLDPTTALPTGLSRPAQAWTRVRWVESTVPVWRMLCDPVAAQVAVAMSTSLAAGLPEDMGAAMGPLRGILDQVGALMFGAQVGQALGHLAREVLSSTDVGLPLGPAGVAALLPVNVAAFGADLSVPLEEVRLYLALREAAHHRLFAHVPWLRGRLLATVEEYARGITVDPSALSRALEGLDPMNPESLQRALGGELFETAPTPAQQATLVQLETLLALVEGWVEVVVDAAARPLPAAPALQETIRRRRGTGGPAEETFATLVGLTLRPRRLREAASLWRALGETRGPGSRDAVWGHPDLLPSSADLDDPAAFLATPPLLDLGDLEPDG
ncbi:MAG: zinc-dependent metalloprotease [Mycobacteriales bacterium]